MKGSEYVFQHGLVEAKSGDVLTITRSVVSSCHAPVVRSGVVVLRPHAPEVAVPSLGVATADNALEERLPPHWWLDRGESALTELLVDCPKFGRLDVSVVMFGHQHPPAAVRDATFPPPPVSSACQLACARLDARAAVDVVAGIGGMLEDERDAGHTSVSPRQFATPAACRELHAHGAQSP